MSKHGGQIMREGRGYQMGKPKLGMYKKAIWNPTSQLANFKIQLNNK